MIKAFLLSLTLFAMTIAGNAFAQALPATDLWLVKIENGVPGQPVKISEGNGYNNQPHFSENGSVIYYTREIPAEDSNAQTDIAAFDTATSTTRMVNNTPESEYSPTPIPGRDALSVIQADLKQKQYLYAIDIGSGEMELLLPDVEPVGYHAWVNDQELAMFILGDSFTLQTARLNTAGTALIADNIGRTLRKHPETGEILFVDKNSEPWQIAAFNPETTDIRAVMPLFPASEDFTIDANGTYWTGNGSKLYRRTPTRQGWELMADYSESGIRRISRLAINLQSGQIALVSDRL
ncbi:hypothetical protein ACFL1J_05945 [Pseudomonadota bacterium]